jgi:hypothetical protein
MVVLVLASMGLSFSVHLFHSTILGVYHCSRINDDGYIFYRCKSSCCSIDFEIVPLLFGLTPLPSVVQSSASSSPPSCASLVVMDFLLEVQLVLMSCSLVMGLLMWLLISMVVVVHRHCAGSSSTYSVPAFVHVHVHDNNYDDWVVDIGKSFVSGARFMVLSLLAVGPSTDVAYLVEGRVLLVVACLLVAARSTLGTDFDLLVVFGLLYFSCWHCSSFSLWNRHCHFAFRSWSFFAVSFLFCCPFEGQLRLRLGPCIRAPSLRCLVLRALRC